jgi:opacity protein-like surface antigen
MRKFLLIVCLLALPVMPSMAQDKPPRYEVFGGYGNIRPEGGQANLNGWHASVAANMNNWFGVAMELSGQYGTQTLSVTNSLGQITQVKAHADFHSLGFGPRFTYRKNERLSPFAHVLFGLARGNWKRPAIVAGEETSFGLAVGGGMDTKLTNHLAFRLIQAEYVRTHFSVKAEKSLRIATGLLFSF